MKLESMEKNKGNTLKKQKMDVIKNVFCVYSGSLLYNSISRKLGTLSKNAIKTAWVIYICEGTIHAEAYVGILETYAAVKMTTFPRNSMSISAAQ